MSTRVRLGSAVPVDRVHVSVYTVPTDGPEADGTIAWDRTTMVLVEVEGGESAASAGRTPAPAPPRCATTFSAAWWPGAT
ncbi:MAG TPA: hypothetical protein VM759_00605 [Longimicrobium sp.]|nr:hypothetical protein [Longimicrobium sp.]